MHHRSTVRGRTKSYDHDGRKTQLCVPCSSQLPISPMPYLEKHRKSSADKDNRDTRRKSSGDVSDLYTHAAADGSSRRYLLGDAPFIEWVVVLRVSLHCKACEGKVRKHISKMEGVRSFSIEMETKKVTIIGDVTPLGVLASVSKVKSAQLWPCL
ncbi:hypothetical protein ACSQ67_022548 [Phaseolus vulgaris]